MKCLGNAEETVGSSARDASHGFLPGLWSLRGILSEREFGEVTQGRGSTVNKDTQEWHINALTSSQPPSPLVTKSRGQENMLYFSKLLIMDISRHTQKKREWYIEPLCMTWRYDAGTFSIAGKCRLDICIIQVATVGDS